MLEKNYQIVEQITKGLKEAVVLNLNPAFSYDRISSDQQEDGDSLEYQSKSSKQYAERKNLHIVYSFTVIESAWKEGRETFNLMLDFALKFDIRELIFKNSDRMSRNHDDASKIEKLVDNNNFQIHFYQSNCIINKNSSPSERLHFNIDTSFARYWSNKISREMKESKRFKAEKGVAPYRSPLGYRHDLTIDKHVINKETESLCRFIFDTFDAKHYSLKDFTKFLNENGYLRPGEKVWHKSRLHDLLTNPFYYGDFRYNKITWKGNHEPYFDKERYNDRLKRLGNKFVGAKTRDFAFVLGKFVKCSCNKIMTGHPKKEKYIYYQHFCTTHNKYINYREEEIFKLIDLEINRIAYNPDFSEFLKHTLQDTTDTKKNDITKERAIISKRIQDTELKINKLLDLYADAQINKERLQSKVNELEAVIKSLNTQRKMLTENQTDFYIKAVDVIETLQKMPNIYTKAPITGKVEILRSMAEGMIIESSNRIKILWAKPYKYLLDEKVLELRTSEEVLTRPVIRGQRDLNPRSSA